MNYVHTLVIQHKILHGLFLIRVIFINFSHDIVTQSVGEILNFIAFREALKKHLKKYAQLWQPENENHSTSIVNQFQ